MTGNDLGRNMAGKGKLTDEDRELWNRVRQSVKPLIPGEVPAEPLTAGRPAGRGGLPEPAQKVPRLGEDKHKQAPPQPTAAPYYPPVSDARPGPPALSRLEPRERRKLVRGASEVDDRLDLHGMRQATAFHTLAGFLRRAQARRLKTVLVITGKGISGDKGQDGSEPGVLRRLVPQWLARDEFRELVIGFEKAARRHGGEGALYIRIRRPK